MLIMNNEKSNEGIRRKIVPGRRNRLCQDAKIRANLVCLRTQIGPEWVENNGEVERRRRRTW